MQQLQLRFDDAESSNEKRQQIREGWRLWDYGGHEPARYRMARVMFVDDPAVTAAHYYL